MTAIPYIGGVYRGTKAERIALSTTNLNAGWLFLETDTGVIQFWNGTSWIDNGIGSDILKSNTNYTMTTADTLVRCDATSGTGMTITLPTAVSAPLGKKYTIKRVDFLASSNLVKIATTSSQTIDGAPDHYLWPAEFVEVKSDGANWQIVDRTNPSLPTYYMIKGTTSDRRIVAANMGLWTAFLTSSTSPAANTLWALPLVVHKTTKFDTISVRITTNSTAGNSRLGIYRDNGNTYPGVLIFDSGALDTSSGGGAAPVTKNATITAGVQVFSTGLYWLTYEQDTATGQMICLGTTGALFGIMGNPSTFGNSIYGYTVTHTFGALPDPYTAGAAPQNGTPAIGAPVPAIGLRPI